MHVYFSAIVCSSNVCCDSGSQIILKIKRNACNEQPLLSKYYEESHYFFRASYARVRYPLSGADIRASEVPFSGPRWKKPGCLQTFSASFPRLLFLFVLKSDKNNSSVIWPSVLSSTCRLGVVTVLYFLDFLFNACGGKKY